jgi:NAD(P)-dependent dehydrogenase (short-subunit alcohol dehydrogenase family)
MEQGRKTVLLIGASRGLGLGLASRYIERGWLVIATERNESKSPALRNLQLDADGRLEIEHVDIDHTDQVVSLASRLRGRDIHLLFINAGILGDEDAAFEVRLLQVMRTNVGGAMNALRLLDELVVADGAVAVMSSELGSVTDNLSGGWEPYRSSKAALNQSLRSYAAERGDVHWSMTSVAPGWVRTEMGGAGAPLDVVTSTTGVVDMLERRFGKRGLEFRNYRDDVLAW